MFDGVMALSQPSRSCIATLNYNFSAFVFLLWHFQTEIDNLWLCSHNTPLMSSILPPRPRHLGAKVRICIVASKYNEEFTDALVENAIDELAKLMPNSRIELIR